MLAASLSGRHAQVVETMLAKKWDVLLPLAAILVGLGLLLVVQLRSQRSVRQAADGAQWENVVAELIGGNARLRDEIETLEVQLAELQGVKGGGVVLESLVDEVNHLRIANGLVEVSGPGVEVEIVTPVSVPDLHDLINELRNAGAEALALSGHRIVAWSAIGTDGQDVTVDGQPVHVPYQLQAIGDVHTLEVALKRPGGLVSLLQQAHGAASIRVSRRVKITLPVYDLPVQFVFAERVE
jgi:uncharacterized protein YlxW (UPF0749 family)